MYTHIKIYTNTLDIYRSLSLTTCAHWASVAYVVTSRLCPSLQEYGANAKLRDEGNLLPVHCAAQLHTRTGLNGARPIASSQPLEPWKRNKHQRKIRKHMSYASYVHKGFKVQTNIIINAAMNPKPQNSTSPVLLRSSLKQSDPRLLWEGVTKHCECWSLRTDLKRLTKVQVSSGAVSARLVAVLKAAQSRAVAEARWSSSCAFNRIQSENLIHF